MYENLLYQHVVKQLSQDFKTGTLPGSILFSGPQNTGKLTCALETARILSCTGKKTGYWLCDCPGCMQHKAMVNNNLILAGPRDCTPEIHAAAFSFLNALENNSSYLEASRYFFIRSVRKLTLRFNPVLWQGDDKLSKIANIISGIDEELEPIDFPHQLPDLQTIQKSCKKIEDLCTKLESDFLYDSIPIAQVRNISSWARLKSVEGKKTIILENADRMLESVRNALLKILEEPPADTVFILTTNRRNAVMSTILSRVRTYQFNERSLVQQKDVLNRVFHKIDFEGSITDYLLTYLPVKGDFVRNLANEFFKTVVNGGIPDISQIIKDCKNFDPRILFKIFLDGIVLTQRGLLSSPAGSQASVELVKAIQQCWNGVSVYNQSISSALELLVRDMHKINKLHGNVLKCVNL